MKDDNNDPRYIADPPEWVWNIIDANDLAMRTDYPLAAATVLLHDAADGLKGVSLSAHRDQAMTRETKLQVARCKAMITDAQRLYELCPTDPVACGSDCEVLPFEPRPVPS